MLWYVSMSSGRRRIWGGPTSDSIDLDTNVRHQHGRGLLDCLSEWLPVWRGKVRFEFGLERIGYGGLGFAEGWWLNGEFGNYAVEAGGGSILGLDTLDKFAAGAGSGGDEGSVRAERDRGGGVLKARERGRRGVCDFCSCLS